jgi:parallel beta-helix repeat protein
MQTYGNRSTYSNNVIHSNAWSGIWHVSGSDNVYSGNTIDSNNTSNSSSGGVAYSGIDFQNQSGRYNTIIGNTIYNGSTGHQAHSVAIRGPNVIWTYIGPNHWYSGATVTALYDQGSATMVHVPSGPGAVTYGPTVMLDASFGDTFTVVVTDTRAFTITPINIHFKGHLYTIRLKNASGGRMGAQTWNPIYKLPTYVAPANNYSKSFTFLDDGTNLICVGYTIADVPN